jgi:hypothetical protein
MNPNEEIFTPSSSRRSMLKSTLTGVTGIAALAGLIDAGVAIGSNQGTAYAASLEQNSSNAVVDADTVQTILNIAVTAETLAVVFYANVLKNAKHLRLGPTARLDIQAALIEEFIHKLFLEKNGAKALTTKFSFPFGNNTFTRFDRFIQVQQLLEALFVAAYMVAGKRFAVLGKFDLVLISAQIGGVEAEHRAVGRALGGLRPANNRAFESTLNLARVSDAPAILTKRGFLTPKAGNTFSFQDVAKFVNSQVLKEVIMRDPLMSSWN